jgi:hypothetical protein
VGCLQSCSAELRSLPSMQRLDLRDNGISDDCGTALGPHLVMLLLLRSLNLRINSIASVLPEPSRSALTSLCPHLLMWLAQGGNGMGTVSPFSIVGLVD